MSTITPHTSRAAGTILSSGIYNSDHENHIANATALNTTILVGLGAWTITTPTPTSSVGTLTTASSVVHSLIEGKKVTVVGTATITTVGSGSGVLQVAMPVAALVSASFSAMNNAVAAPSSAYVPATSNTLTIITSAALASGQVHFFSGVYEAS